MIPEALEGLKLTGAGMDVTIVESLDLETGITIEAHGVTLSDFLITGGDVGIFAHGQAETPITGLVLERLVLDGIENPTIQCSHCYNGDGGEDGGCTSDGANKQCFFSDTIGIDLAYTQGAQVSLVTFSSIEGARAPGTSFWYFLSGRPAIGLQVSDSTGLTVSANQITGPLKGGLGQKKQKNRSAPSGASIGMGNPKPRPASAPPASVHSSPPTKSPSDLVGFAAGPGRRERRARRGRRCAQAVRERPRVRLAPVAILLEGAAVRAGGREPRRARGRGPRDHRLRSRRDLRSVLHPDDPLLRYEGHARGVARVHERLVQSPDAGRVSDGPP